MADQPTQPTPPPHQPGTDRPAAPAPYDRHADRDLGRSVLRDHHLQADAHTGRSGHGRVEVPPDQHPERHEHTDVSVRGIVLTVAGITVGAMLALAFIYVVHRGLLNAHTEADVRARRTALEPARQFPPEDVPKLQALPGYHAGTPVADMAALRDRNVRALSSYGYQPDGTAYIPVSRAMDLALERDLFPARQDPSAGDGSTTRPATRPQGGPSGAQH